MNFVPHPIEVSEKKDGRIILAVRCGDVYTATHADSVKEKEQIDLAVRFLIQCVFEEYRMAEFGYTAPQNKERD